MVELPKDATGCEIPLTATLLYDKYGDDVTVYSYKYDPRIEEWSVDTIMGTRLVSTLYLTPLDNWEKLENDLKMGADGVLEECCCYFGLRDGKCKSCAAYGSDSCDSFALKDILNRIRNLRGETHDC